MSITAETAKQHAHDPAVLCCRAEAGITIGPENLEDPSIFDELVDSGLLNLDGCLQIHQILGAKLTKTCDSLTPITVEKRRYRSWKRRKRKYWTRLNRLKCRGREHRWLQEQESL